MKKITGILLALVLAIGLVGCAKETTTTESFTYTKDTELGEGEKSFTVEVVDGEGNKVTLQVSSDEQMVGKALLDLGVIEGEEGEFGLYIKKVNGVTADYDVDQTYWAFYIDGEYALTGADMTEIAEGSVYSFKVEK